MSQPLRVTAEPYAFEFSPTSTALLVIDMQRDFVEPGGFGETLGNDTSLLQAVIPPLREVLTATRAAGTVGLEVAGPVRTGLSSSHGQEAHDAVRSSDDRFGMRLRRALSS